MLYKCCFISYTWKIQLILWLSGLQTCSLTLKGWNPLFRVIAVKSKRWPATVSYSHTLIYLWRPTKILMMILHEMHVESGVNGRTHSCPPVISSPKRHVNQVRSLWECVHQVKKWNCSTFMKDHWWEKAQTWRRHWSTKMLSHSTEHRHHRLAGRTLVVGVSSGRYRDDYCWRTWGKRMSEQPE